MVEDIRICPSCGGRIAIRNPTGNCDHLYYPDYLTDEAKMKTSCADPDLMPCTLDIDSKPKIPVDMVTYLLHMLQAYGKVHSVYRRTSASGKGWHVLFFIPVKGPLGQLKEMKESLFGLRLLLGDDVARVSIDINRLKSTHDQDSIMRLFDGKWNKEIGMMQCGPWEKVIAR